MLRCTKALKNQLLNCSAQPEKQNTENCLSTKHPLSFQSEFGTLVSAFDLDGKLARLETGGGGGGGDFGGYGGGGGLDAQLAADKQRLSLDISDFKTEFRVRTERSVPARFVPKESTKTTLTLRELVVGS